MKKLIIYSLTFILCLLFVFNSNSFAQNIKGYFSSSHYQGSSSSSFPSFEKASSSIFVILRSVGIVAAACLLVFLAIQWMIQPPNKQAELKGRLGYYIGGIIFLVALEPILNFFISVAEEIASLL